MTADLTTIALTTAAVVTAVRAHALGPDALRPVTPVTTTLVRPLGQNASHPVTLAMAALGHGPHPDFPHPVAVVITAALRSAALRPVSFGLVALVHPLGGRRRIRLQAGAVDVVLLLVSGAGRRGGGLVVGCRRFDRGVPG